MPPSQISGAILMVRPKHFGFNAETAETNRFQRAGAAADVGIQARLEFDAFAAALAAEGVTVCVVEDSDEPRKPDAVFPNNWVSFHADGTVVLYPMQAASRRAERRAAVIEQVSRDTGFEACSSLGISRWKAASSTSRSATTFTNACPFSTGTGRLPGASVGQRDRTASQR